MVFRRKICNWQGTHDVTDYDIYCHYVAGLVGEGLSRQFAASGLEPPALAPYWKPAGNFSLSPIAEVDSVFHIDHLRLATAETLPLPGRGLRLLAVTAGQWKLPALILAPGQFALMPDCAENPSVQGEGAQFLLTQAA